MVSVCASLLLLMAVCGQVHAENNINERLAKSIGYYVDGEYRRAADSLQTILPRITDENMEATAYKYLGFSYVMLDRIPEARESFGAALQKFPGIELDTLEVPPSISVVFKEVKLSQRVEKAESGTRRLTAGILMGAGMVSSGAAGYLLYESKRSYEAYQGVSSRNQALMDRHYDSHVRTLAAGVGLGAAALIMLPTSVYLFFDRGEKNQTSIRLRLTPSSAAVCWHF
jgi:tetratricopeptide (TPR) repeat protein